MKQGLYTIPILDNVQLCPEIWMLKLKSREISSKAKPGQFLMIRVSQSLDPLLPRPFSLCRIRPREEYVAVVYKAGGPGTTWLARRKKGETLPVLGPLGKSFRIPEKGKAIALVGGGIGVTPLISLGEEARKQKKEIHFFLGLRNIKSMTVTDEMLSFVPKSRRHFTTDNGSLGKRGDIVDYLKTFLEKNHVDYIASCGPKPMLKALQKLVVALGIQTEVAVEEAMACGLGYCQGCAVALNDGSPRQVLACKDGPILPLDRLLM